MARKGSGGTAPPFLNFGTVWQLVFVTTPLRYKHRCHSVDILQKRTFLPLPEFEASSSSALRKNSTAGYQHSAAVSAAADGPLQAGIDNVLLTVHCNVSGQNCLFSVYCELSTCSERCLLIFRRCSTNSSILRVCYVGWLKISKRCSEHVAAVNS
jgi:hypothetical protein